MERKLLKSIYIHIPFCKTKCNYCNFISYTDKFLYLEKYFIALNREISFYLKNFSDLEIKTIYIGGGTPSLIDIFYFEKIFNTINNYCEIFKKAEITIEINPGKISEHKLNQILNCGINRISIGVQTFNDKILKILNRSHSSDEAVQSVKLAKAVGFNNISIDLIYGLPSQSLKNWENTLEEASRLEINHISAYGLKIEKNTKFFLNPPLNLPDEDTSVEMYLKTIEILEKNGFIQYEISNFAKPGFESAHNLCYWQNHEYFGFGAGAHGYVSGKRYGNLEIIEEYINDPLKKSFEIEISAKEKMEEAIFLGLRLRKGVNLHEFKRVYNVDLVSEYKSILDKHISNGLLFYENNNIKLSNTGILLSNKVMADFIS